MLYFNNNISMVRFYSGTVHEIYKSRCYFLVKVTPFLQANYFIWQIVFGMLPYVNKVNGMNSYIVLFAPQVL